MRTSSSPAPAPTPSWTGCRGSFPGLTSVIPGPDRESPHPGFIRSRNRAGFQDRLLELTRTLSDREMESQVLDDMDLEKEKGITIKSHAIQMEYTRGGETYRLNLIDTPGHVDFS